MEPVIFELQQNRFFTSDLQSWEPHLSSLQNQEVSHALEQGQVVYLPNLVFALTAEEKNLFTLPVLPKGQKNISYSAKANRLTGVDSNQFEQILSGMLKRYHDFSCGLLQALCPHYEAFKHSGRTSYRPVEILGRKSSYRKDDTRLHVDAFPATPVNNLRILRVFSNINPYGEARYWKLGEPFHNVMQRFLPKIRAPFPFETDLLYHLKLTKKKRLPYDHYMLKVHNRMKKDMDYQQSVAATPVAFPAGSSWIVYTDLVSHAALQGRFVLEQTYYPPIEKMQLPNLSPQHQLLSVLF